MTSSRSPRSRHRAAIAAVAIGPALVACTGTAAPVALPPWPSPAAPAVFGSPAISSAQQQVIAVRASYTVAVGNAERSGDAAKARALLRPYLAADRIDGLVQTMSSIWAKGEVFFGQDVLHILRVTVTDTRAFVYDCDDTSGMGLKYAATGQIVPGSEGTPDMNLITRLDLSAGRWLVQVQVVVAEPCTA